jgi:WD40 repeat protein
MAARAVGFAGYGRGNVPDAKFDQEYPVLLSAGNGAMEEKEARQQVFEASSGIHFWLPLWHSPLSRQHRDRVTSVAWSPDGRTLASGSWDRTVRLWEVPTGKLLATLEGHTKAVTSVAWSPDGKALASGALDNTVRLWEVPTGKPLATLEGHTTGVTSVAWSPDGKALASGSGDPLIHDGVVRLWEVPTGKPLATLAGHAEAVRSVAWSPDGRTLASGAEDSTVRLWEASTGKPLSTLAGHTAGVGSVAWSPDGRTLASGSEDGTVKLWEVPTGKPLATLKGHTRGVTSVAWSPDGRTLASGAWDSTVRLWKVPTGKPLATLKGHTGYVTSVAWSPDGKALASGAEDRTVRLWEASALPEIELAEYLRSRWVRLVGSEMVWEINTDNLLHDRKFEPVNLRGANLLSIERNGLPGSEKLRQELSLLLRAANYSSAVAVWNAALPNSADQSARRLFLTGLCAVAADDLASATRWRGLWLVRQIQSILTPEAMADPAVSLTMLRLSTQLAALGADDTTVVSVCKSFNACIAGMAPRPWLVGLGRNLLVATTETDATGAAKRIEAAELFPEAVAAYRSEQPQEWARAENNLGDALWTLGERLDGEEGLKRRRESAEAFRQVLAYQPTDQLRFLLAQHLGYFAFELVLSRQFAEAQTRCEEAQRLANEIGDGIQKTDRDDLIFIQQNLAHALLFQGHFDEALAIYRQNWDKPLRGKTFGELTLEDFAAFDKAGLIHPDLPRMKRVLEDLHSKALNP